ncbi:stage II sporulation protein D [Bacillus andreraoultii]|uniref:stage II sporulation protein D n=1 Tax=Bacillus andreraoultii TaxID=1499685 RepID=UPI00053ADDB2|nr:stage II sporulation protein D [Bacillus andreraoultii]
MKKVNPIILFSIFFIVVILIVPSILVLPYSKESTKVVVPEKEPETNLEKKLAEASPINVSVYRTKKDEVETIPLEHYVVGVVGAEMPADFEYEALKAQSLTARTYIVKLLMEDKQVGILKGADISDTENTHQVYKSEDELKKAWGANYNKNINKIRKAVYETRGKILVFNDRPIEASYFSTSNGYTENAEDYWTDAIPYLKSVKSPWDVESPKFTDQVKIPVNEFEKKLGVKINSKQVGEIISRTASNRVEKAKVGGKEFTGRDIREKLGLRSSDFSWKLDGSQVVITTKGFGHGIGMSQYGANGMAKEGKSVNDIVKYYYNGVAIEEASTFLEKYVAKK